MNPNWRRPLFAFFLGTLSFLGCSDSVTVAHPEQSPLLTQAPFQSPRPVQGITISTRRSGQEWGREIIRTSMSEIQSVGANWVATHPYAWIRNDGRVSAEQFNLDTPPESLVRPIREAHALGMKIMIKPHIGYWSSKFNWRGEIDFQDPEQRAHFFRSYRKWILSVAKATREADAFAIGTELDRLLDEKEWRELIDEIRKVTDAKLTYAANWTDFERVGFWDALDWIGIQAYFPLTDQRTSDPEVLDRAWNTRMSSLRSFALEHKKKIVFTELGYNRSFEAAVRPWESAIDGPEAIHTQLACLSSALSAIAQEEAVLGAFLWKWFPESEGRDHDFMIQASQIQDLLRKEWF